MHNRISLLLLSCVALAAPCLHAEDVVEKPLGEPVERHLSDYQPFRQWVNDPALFEKEAGDRLETRQVAGVTLIVGLAVAAMSAIHLASIARFSLEESALPGELLARHRLRAGGEGGRGRGALPGPAG